MNDVKSDMKSIEKGEVVLDDQNVLHYLRQQPDFFIRNARSIEQMHIPHPVKGAVSLVEWQLSRQRQQIERLEEEITLLMEAARVNEALFSQLLQLHSDLATSDSLQQLLERLQGWARSQGLSGATIRLFSEQWQLGAPSRFPHLALARQTFEPIRIQRMGGHDHYLGPLNGSELAQLLPDAGSVGSVALMLLGEQGNVGVLIFSSRDNQHYQPHMGTLLLRHLSLLLPDLLLRWLARA